jgi:hypothetical protein
MTETMACWTWWHAVLLRSLSCDGICTSANRAGSTSLGVMSSRLLRHSVLRTCWWSSESAHTFPDLVENAGQEAVLNAAACALRRPCDGRAFRLLLSLAERRRLAGAIEALGRCETLAALPCFLDALSDDMARPAAEAAIRRLGEAASQALVQAISDNGCARDGESESSRRRRRSALNLLLETGTVRDIPPTQRQALVADEDPALAILACRASLACGSEDERRGAIKRLVDLLYSSHRWFRWEAEECLLAHPDDVRKIIGPVVRTGPPNIGDLSPQAKALRALHHIAGRTATRRHDGA